MPWITIDSGSARFQGLSASMRPRRNAVDNVGPRWKISMNTHASMRPRRNAVDNTVEAATGQGRLAGFNEATAKCRG